MRPRAAPAVVRVVVVAAALILAVGEARAQEAVYQARSDDGLPVYSNVPTQAGQQPWLIFGQPLVHDTSALSARTVVRARPAVRCCDAQIASALNAGARASGLEEALLRAVIHVESGFDREARSAAGAVGLMQLMPAAARRYGVRDPTDPAQNVLGGARYLKDLLAAFGGDLSLALAAYNAGADAVKRSGNRIPPYAETQAYVPAVLAKYRSELLADARIRRGSTEP